MRNLPLERHRHNVPQPFRDLGNTVISNPSINLNFDPGINRGTVSRLSEGGFLIFWGRGGPIKFLLSRSFTKRFISRAALYALTIPVTELTSAIAIAGRPRSAARIIYSSGCDAPVKNVKFDIIDNSANIQINMFLFCSLSSSSFIFCIIFNTKFSLQYFCLRIYTTALINLRSKICITFFKSWPLFKIWPSMPITAYSPCLFRNFGRFSIR